MKKLYIKSSEHTPEIDFNPEINILNIRGASYPENTFKFYEPILEWLNEYFSEIDTEIKVIINFEITYYNSSSSKVLLDIFDIFEEADLENKQIEINWIYNSKNESALETGEDFQDDFEELNIQLIER